MKSLYHKEIAACLKLYASLPELRTEYCNFKPEWNDEKALNETFCALVICTEDKPHYKEG